VGTPLAAQGPVDLLTPGKVVVFFLDGEVIGDAIQHVLVLVRYGLDSGHERMSRMLLKFGDGPGASYAAVVTVTSSA
jgi:hypothetical protein